MAIESELKEFVQIVELGSVSAAARALGLPRASVSRRLAKLETSYGVQLIHRDTHRQILTRAGQELYQRARRIVAELSAATVAVAALDGVPRGLLRVGMPPGAGLEMTLAKAYLEAYPEVTLEFVGAHTHDDLLSNNIDVALRTGQIEDERLIGRKIAQFHNVAYSSPKLIEKLGMPTLETLCDYPCILSFDSLGRPVTEWPLWSGGSVVVSGMIRSNNMENRVEGALMGLGMTMAADRFVRRWIKSGDLVPVLNDVIGSTSNVSLVWPDLEFMEPKVRAFIDLAVETIKNMVKRRDEKTC